MALHRQIRRRGRWARCLTVSALALMAGAAGTAAEGPGLVSELRLGILHHDTPGLWSGFNREDGSVALNGEVLFAPSLAVFGGRLRPAIGGTIARGGGTSKGYLDARWEIEGPRGIFLMLGLGAAVHDGNLTPSDPDRKALGSRVLFHIPLEIGWRWDGRNSVSVYFDHISNGYTQRFNEGLDTIGVRYGYRF